jgi:dUTP pyrophosphatase
MVMTGIIDNGYRGPLLAVAYNQSDTVANIKIGDRLAQLILIPMLTPPVVQVDQLSDTERGGQGYGSTGR